LAGEIGGKVDIVINNAEVHRSHGIGNRTGTDVARMEMEINYLGLLRLSQALGPALQGRAADGVTHACAWVNLLSIYALSNFPSHGTYSASKAAAYSLSRRSASLSNMTSDASMCPESSTPRSGTSAQPIRSPDEP
jgi:NAD(P)-dependent dehydrogenase (short-subunit alcohol dehydrogenase family)